MKLNHGRFSTDSSIMALEQVLEVWLKDNLHSGFLLQPNKDQLPRQLAHHICNRWVLMLPDEAEFWDSHIATQEHLLSEATKLNHMLAGIVEKSANPPHLAIERLEKLPKLKDLTVIDEPVTPSRSPREGIPLMEYPTFRERVAEFWQSVKDVVLGWRFSGR